LFNPPGADKPAINTADKPAINTADKPLPLRAFNAFQDTPLLCGGVVHFDFSNYTASIKDITYAANLYSGYIPVLILLNKYKLAQHYSTIILGAIMSIVVC